MGKWGIGIAAVAGVVVVGGLGTSYYMGTRVQNGFEEFTQAVNQGNKLITVKTLSYQRGLFSSTAQTEWTVVSRRGDQLTFKADHDISHGPLPRGHAVEVDTKFLLNDEVDPGLKAALNGKPPLTWHTNVGWSKQMSNTLTSPEFTAQLKGGTLGWGGMKAEFSMPAEFQSFKGNAEFTGLNFTDAQQRRVDIKGGSALWDMKQADGQEFLVGPFKMALASATIQGSFGASDNDDEEDETSDASDAPGAPSDGAASNTADAPPVAAAADAAVANAAEAATKAAEADKPQPPAAASEPVTFEGMSFDTNTVLAGDVVNMDINTTIKTIDIPQYKVSDVAINFALLNFDAAWITKFQKLSQQDNDIAELRGELMKSLPQLLSRKPEFQIKRIAMRTEEGVSEISGGLAFASTDPNKPVNPLQDIKANLALNLPKPVMQSLMSHRVRQKYLQTMEELDQQVDVLQLKSAVDENVKDRIDALLEAHLLEEKDNNYSASFSWANGELQANGKPLEQDGLMTLMTSMP